MGTYKKVLTKPLWILIGAISMGLLMKILGWPMANEVMLISFIAIGSLYTYRFWKKPLKRFNDYNKLVFILFWALNGVLNILDVPHNLFIHSIIAISFVLWFVFEGTSYFLRGNQKVKNRSLHLLWNVVMVLGTLAIIAGSLLKILNWEYSTLVLILGIAILCAYIFKDTFSTNQRITKEEQNNEEYQL
ncbi:hypothetical protein [Maribacter luteus]|uniref:Uncharacterized protein n=1 Tax=Maribacter luteus TaxID=2594478 RepID=A0A6I2MM96_9FLAO|nr:hypothetical protein [Maribacter luteus]MRX64858.1 hypothetical protein [Maribacter luteus]|tara:strand:+ start:3166 stop:3732 length:567 start_codon:yes stop_codon:yes gene_type:complete